MKNILKKWWIWLIISIIIVALILIIKEYQEKNKLEETFKNIGKSATDMHNKIENAEGYLDYFTYNYDTEEVGHHPPITLEKYDNIKEGMTEKEVVSILGNGEKLQPEGSNGFLMTWGDLNLSNAPYYRIQINFDSSGKVFLKSQIGLE